MNGIRHLLLVLALSLLWPHTLTGQAKKEPSLERDWQALQGVWKLAGPAKTRIEMIVLERKIGYEVNQEAAKKGDTLLSFLALSPAEIREEKGKRFLVIPITKTEARKLRYHFEKDQLFIDLPRFGELKATRLNTPASTNAEAKKLLGTWSIVEAEAAGVAKTAKDIGLDEIMFTEDRYILKAGGREVLNSFYRVDAAKKPPIMDWYGMKASFVIPLIYDLNGDELFVCHPLLGKDAPKTRPTTFETKNTATLAIRAKRTAK